MLAADNSTLKDWFMTAAAHYIAEREQPSLPNWSPGSERGQLAEAMTVIENDAAQKLRGGITPPQKWPNGYAHGRSGRHRMNPGASCGDGAFLEAAAARFVELGSRGPTIADHLVGIEILAGEAERARSGLRGS